ncbi:MAG: TraR/DksA C4-type zinc finger protein, partial [Notoacmeibacter sp.]|nr:TraR/DksA C4-type zinc finger protein [Notoacmeibacter sp.]
LKRIDAALDRIEAGTYGVCAKCGEDITEERLDLLPATPFCRNCA